MGRKQKDLLVTGHKPITRRDFLAQGYISSLGFVVAPSVLSMLASLEAKAACAVAATAGKTPVMIFDLAGGANLVGGEAMVGKAGGQLDFLGANSYQTLGLPPDQHPSMAGRVVTVNGKPLGQGLAFHANSDILRGMQTTGALALPNVDGAVFCAASGDDTRNNPFNPGYWLHKAGATGSLVQLVGVENNDSGGNSVAPQPSVNPSIRTVQVQSANQARGLIQLGVLGNLFQTNGAANNEKIKKILDAAQMTSSYKLQAFNNLDLSAQMKELVNCGLLEARDLVGKFSQAGVDPTQDALVTAAFPNIANNAGQRQTATIAKLVLDGYAGVGTVSLGGYDYHNDNNRNVQAQKNANAGALIGAAMDLARRKNKSLMVIVVTDGAVASGTTVNNGVDAKGRFDFTNDNGSRSGAIMMLYRPDAAPVMASASRQSGAYSDNGAVDRGNNQISDNVTNLAKAFVANYLALTGEESKLASVVGTESLLADRSKYIFFGRNF